MQIVDTISWCVTTHLLPVGLLLLWHQLSMWPAEALRNFIVWGLYCYGGGCRYALVHQLLFDTARIGCGESCSSCYPFGVMTHFIVGTLLFQYNHYHPTIFEPDRVMEVGFEPVCDQLQAGSSYLDMSR